VKLTEWLDEYRNFDPDGVTRPAADPIDDWEEESLLAPVDRVHDTAPRWLERAERIGYGRATQI
jgi:hypothetical protein